VILHLIDGTEEDVLGAYKMIRKELKAYGGGLIDKPEVIGLNKADAIPEDELKAKVAKLKRSSKRPVYVLSGATGAGVPAVLHALRAEMTAKQEALELASRAKFDTL
jgi:GTP-binding protein